VLGLLTALVMNQAAPLEVSTAADVKRALASRSGPTVLVRGSLERVEVRHGQRGTALVLDDDTRVYVTYGEPPADWAPQLGRFVSAEGQLTPQAVFTIQSLMAPHLKPSGVPQVVDRSLSALRGKRARLVGTAKNAKGGAVLMVKDSPLYIAGLQEWPKDQLNQRVALSGVVKEETYLPQAFKNAKGEVSQGAEGQQWVLREASAASTF
jgi:hypothetical protein